MLRVRRFIDRLFTLRGEVWIFILAAGLSLAGMPYLGSSIDSTDQLDSSWSTYMYTVISRHIAIGYRYVWTYGPLGFLDTPIEYNRGLLAVDFMRQHMGEIATY